jgi:hypothetical protein
MSLPCGEQKRRIRRREGLHDYRRKAQQELLSNSIKASSNSECLSESQPKLAKNSAGFERIPWLFLRFSA